MSKQLKNSFKFLVVGLAFFTLGLLSMRHVIFNQGLVSGLDWPIPPERLQVIHLFTNSLYTWTDAHIFTGQPQQALAIQLLPLWGVLALMAKIGLSGEEISKICLLLFFSGGGVSSFFLFRTFKLDFIASFLGALIFLITSFSLDWLIIGGIGEFLALYALLPLSMAFFLRALENSKYRFIWLFLTVLTTFLYPLFSVVLQSIIFLSYSVFLIFSDKRYRFKTIAVILFAYYLLYVLFNLYWLLPVAVSFSRAFGGLNVRLSLGEVFNFYDGLRLWSKLAPLFEISLVQGSRILRIVRRFLSFGLPILAFLALYYRRKEKPARFFATLNLLLQGLIVFPPIYYLIENNILFLGIFRHVNKFYPVLALTYAFLIALAIKKNEGKRSLFSGVFALATVLFFSVYYLPFLKNGSFNGYLRLVNYPSEYRQLSSLGKDDPKTKALWLPTGSGYLRPEGRVDGSWVSDHWAIHSENAGGINEINYRFGYVPELWLNNIFYRPNSKENPQLAKLLAVFNVGDIILREDTEITQWAIPLWGDIWSWRTHDIKANIEEEKGISQQNSLGQLTTYQVSTPLPLIYQTDKAVLAAGELGLLERYLAVAGTEESLRPMVFSQQMKSPGLDIPAEQVFIENNNILGLAAVHIPERYKIKPGDYIESQMPFGEWTDYHLVAWWYKNDYQEGLGHSVFTMGGKAVLEIPLKIIEENSYSILLNGFQGVNNGDILISIKRGDSLAGTFRRNFKSATEDGFVWQLFGDLHLSEGEYRLSLFSDDEAVVSEIIVAPAELLEEAGNKALEIVDGKKLFLTYDLWDYSPRVEFDIPKAGEYEISLDQPGKLKNYQIDGEPISLPATKSLTAGKHILTAERLGRPLEMEKFSFETDEEVLLNIPNDLLKKDLYGLPNDSFNSISKFPVITDKLDKDASDGSRSIKISSLGQSAGILKNIDRFSSDIIYRISFDYKNIKGEPGIFSVVQGRYDFPLEDILTRKLAPDGKEVFEFPKKILRKENFWQKHEEIVSFLPGVNKIGVLLASPPDEDGAINLYDNLQIEPVRKLSLTISETNDANRTIPSLSQPAFRRINPTKYEVSLGKNEGKQSLLVFLEKYDPQWKAYILPKDQKEWMGETWFRKPLEDKSHFSVYGYANSWLIDSQDGAGEYKVILEYWPQRIVWAGLFASGAFFVLISTIGALIFLKKRDV